MSQKIDLKQAESLTGITYKTLKKRIEAAELQPVGKSGKSLLYDSAQLLPALYRDEAGNADDVRKMLVEEQLREKKRQNDIAEGLIAPLSLLTDALTQVGTKIVAQLEALPLEMKRANPRLTGHDIQVVKKSIAKCCNAIAETNIDVE